MILYGPPGSGKGTQANLLATKIGLIHFDTGRFCESLVHDPDRQNEKLIQRERKLFDSGKLMTPSFVLNEVKKQTAMIGKAGWGLAFSGSPRTMYEAEGLLPVLAKIFGKKNIFVFSLAIPDSVSIKRNSNRMLCGVCGAPLLTAYYPKTKVKPKHCPVCGGPFYKRSLDNVAVIKVRLKEYRDRTYPILAFAKKKGFKIYSIDGTPAPFKVYQEIRERIG